MYAACVYVWGLKCNKTVMLLLFHQNKNPHMHTYIHMYTIKDSIFTALLKTHVTHTHTHAHKDTKSAYTTQTTAYLPGFWRTTSQATWTQRKDHSIVRRKFACMHLCNTHMHTNKKKPHISICMYKMALTALFENHVTSHVGREEIVSLHHTCLLAHVPAAYTKTKGHTQAYVCMPHTGICMYNIALTALLENHVTSHVGRGVTKSL